MSLSRNQNIRLAVVAAAERVGSQSALAHELGVSVPTVSKWANGRRQPNQDNLAGIVSILGINPEEIDRDGEGFKKLMFGLPNFKNVDVPLRSLRAVEDHRDSWAENWKSVQGKYRYIYSHKNGDLEISEISFVALHKMGIITRMTNTNSTDAGKVLSWKYEGYTYLINDFGYVTLSHVPADPDKKGTELFFMIFRLPTGADGEPMFGHLLARGTKGREQRSATSPCVLLAVRDFPSLEPLIGTFASSDPRLATILTPLIRGHLLIGE